MGSGVHAHIDVRQRADVAISLIQHLANFVFRVARPVNHAVANGDGHVNPVGHRPMLARQREI
jgi:hypothetical protein